MELRHYAGLAWRWSWLLLLGAGLAGAIAYLLSRAETPVYRATATILVNEAQNVARPTFSDVQANQQLSKTYSQIVTSAPVLEAVGAENGLTYEELHERVTASARRETQLIDIAVRDTDPDRAAILANRVAQAFADRIQQTQLGQQSAVEQDLERQSRSILESLGEARQRATQLAIPQPGLPENERVQQLNAALSQVEGLSQRLSTVESNLQNLRIERAKSANSVTPVNPARVPGAPVSPRVTFNTALGVVLGLVAAVGIIAAIEYLDDTVKTAADVTRVAGLATLGTVERFRRGGRRAVRRRTDERPSDSADVLVTSPQVGEAYRMVRANLEFARGGQPGHTVLVTSALPGEGKSTTVANLAQAQAQTGKRVILVDTDLRRPSLHKALGVPNSVGLSTLFVMEEPSVAGLLRATPVEHLLLLPTGPLPPNPAELLASERMDAIVTLLRAEADIVLFDSPPLLSVADGLTLAARVDGVVLVVDAGRTRSGLVARAAESLRQAHARIWGVVLNKTQARRGEGYYYYYGRPGELPRPRDGAAPLGADPAIVRTSTVPVHAPLSRASYAEEPDR